MSNLQSLLALAQRFEDQASDNDSSKKSVEEAQLLMKKIKDDMMTLHHIAKDMTQEADSRDLETGDEEVTKYDVGQLIEEMFSSYVNAYNSAAEMLKK